jgi:hypothetical protein
MRRELYAPFAAALILAFLCGGIALADIPTLEDKGRIMDGALPLDAGSSSTPSTSDWNNDGAIDLLVGSSQGYVKLYLNQGNNLSPHFNGYSHLECAGVPINMTAG